jgi:hypothetical protein
MRKYVVGLAKAHARLDRVCRARPVSEPQAVVGHLL